MQNSKKIEFNPVREVKDVEEGSIDSSDSENDKFKQQAKGFLRRHVKTMLDTQPTNEKRSRQNFEEFRSNQVMANHNLLSQENTELADNDVLSMNTEDVGRVSRKLSKEDLFKLLYSKVYDKEPSPNRYKGKKNKGVVAKILMSATISKDQLPVVSKTKQDSQTNLATIQEDRYSKFGNTMSFLNNGNKNNVAMPPKKKSSYELMNEVFSKTKYNNVASILSPVSVDKSDTLEKMTDSTRQGNKTIKAAQAKTASCMNEYGLLRVMLNKIDKDKNRKIQKTLERIHKD